MKTQLEKKKTQTLSNTIKTENVSEKTQNTSQNPFLSGNENTTNPFTKSAPAQFAGLGGFLKAGKRLAGNILGGKSIKDSINDVKSHNAEKREQKDAGGEVGLAYVIKNPTLKAMFYSFLVKENNVENLECFDLLQRIKRNSMPMLFTEMYNLYLSNDAPYQVNIGGATMRASKALADKIKENPLGQAVDSDVLEKLDKELEINLMDPFSRFKTSAAFENRHNA